MEVGGCVGDDVGEGVGKNVGTGFGVGGPTGDDNISNHVYAVGDLEGLAVGTVGEGVCPFCEEQPGPK